MYKVNDRRGSRTIGMYSYLDRRGRESINVFQFVFLRKRIEIFNVLQKMAAHHQILHTFSLRLPICHWTTDMKLTWAQIYRCMHISHQTRGGILTISNVQITQKALPNLKVWWTWKLTKNRNNKTTKLGIDWDKIRVNGA